MKLSVKLFVVFFILLTVFSRFYGIFWGAPFFFHPDERNIASAISQLHIPQNINPHFFAYGSFPIYCIYFLGVVINLFVKTPDIFALSFEQAIIIGRIFSATFSTLLIVLLYKYGEKIHSQKVGFLAAFLGITSIAFIQFAHFSTFEMWLTFFSFLLAYVAVLYHEKPKRSYLFSIGLLLGILIGTKISSLVLYFPVVTMLILEEVTKKKKWYKKITDFLLQVVPILYISVIIYFVTNPYTILDVSSFRDSIHYETAVATGQLPVFYTQGFMNTIPVIYQMIYVYPFLLNTICALVFLPSIFFFTLLTYKGNPKNYAITLLFFLILFFSQSILFVKWTRYMIPTIPFIIIFISIFCLHAYKNTTINMVRKILTFFIIFYSFLIANLFIYQTYGSIDTRVAAYTWAKNHISPTSDIVSEVYDLGIVPFNDRYTHITLFNFYDLDTDTSLKNQLDQDKEKNQYIILPSQRLLKNRVQNKKLFPSGNTFYNDLMNEKGYKKIYQTPCNIFCKLIYNFDPVFNLEETATVFDHPIVYIFKKI